MLSSRLIDRPLRPLFRQGTIRNDVQVVATVISQWSRTFRRQMYSVDRRLGLALCISAIFPFAGPTAGVDSGLGGRRTTF